MAEVLTNNDIDTEITAFNNCSIDLSGFNIPGINMPGLGSLIATFIRTIEAGLTTSFEPFLQLIQMVKDIPSLPGKITSFISDFNELLTDPINFIIKKLIDPIIKNFTMPIPSIKILTQFLLGTIDLKSIDFTIPSNILIPAKFAIIAPTVQAEILKNLNLIIPKMLDFLLIPAKVMIGFFSAFVKLILDALSVDKLPAFVAKWLTPIEGLMDMIGKLFGTVIGAIISTFTPVDISSILPLIISYITGIFTGVSDRALFKKLSLENPVFGSIKGIIATLQCFIEIVIDFIKKFPGLFIK